MSDPTDVSPTGDTPQAAEASASASSTTASSTGHSTKRGRRNLAGVALGNALEWYDWTAYAVFASFFSTQIFAPEDPNAAILATFAVFAVGFAVRPVGGIFFGWLADRHGRKASLLLAIACASGGMLLIAVAPTYSQAGLLGAVVLLIARLLQGVAHTGEVAAAYTYVAEAAPARRRGLWASSIFTSGTAAILVATILGAILTSVLSKEAMTAWGWRLPFILGAVIALFTLYLRRKLDETEAFTTKQQETQADRVVERTSSSAPAPKPGLVAGLWANRTAALRVFAMGAALGVFYYTWAIGAPSWAVSALKIPAQSALWASVIAQAIGLLALPLVGSLSDRIGRRPVMIAFGLLGALLAWPLDLLAHGGTAWHFGLAMTGGLLVFALLGAVYPAVIAEFFPTGVRASGIAVPYALAATLFAGTAPYLRQWLGQINLNGVFVAYVAATALLTAWVMFRAPETRGIDLTEKR
ncbi:MFS transporter [Pseudonocardia sp. NPDC049154]|uniref:MFS transporter n=1 Tax=Pseudonocardia sp. NPDC049154 TaxID=3155501 RepID=UPI0033DD9488